MPAISAPSAASPSELVAEGGRLLDFARGSRLPGVGFGWLDEKGRPDPSQPLQTWITARMTYVFSLGQLAGYPGAGELADHGVAALDGPLRDAEYGGWLPAVPTFDAPGTDLPQEKRAYDHAFVVLAAAAAVLAGRDGAPALLTTALEVVDRHFWRAEDGLAVDTWDRGWSRLEDYRGANANFHLIEAYLLAAEATGDPKWRLRALGIAERLLHGQGRAYGWRVPEHFDPSWRVLPDYNRDDPAHQFRPYGATVGHWLECARLLAHLHLGLDDPPGWLLEDARALFAAAVRDGWAVDGADGFVYTVDWDGRPVVRTRMHWVVAEAISAAGVLHSVVGEQEYADWLARWWGYAERCLIDRDAGSWHHELDPGNRPSATVWPGKPDTYHAYQAVLLSGRPAASSVAAGLLR